jgi:hypothetical protein
MLGLPRHARLSFASAGSAVLVALMAVGLHAGCTCGSGPYQGDYFDGDRPGAIQNVKFVESEKGDPKIVGCADGQREGFADLTKNPRIAGCVGVWEGSKSLRDKPTGKPCGDDGEKCTVPADVCAQGWHVCGFEGKADDLRDRAEAKDCDNAGPGRFNAAVSHSPSDEIDPCPKITKTTELPCVQAGLGSEPVCCGNDCLSGKCKDGVWKGRTRISRGTTEGCGAVTSERNGGVLCCYDGDGNPADAVAGAKADDAKAEGDDAKAEGDDAKAEGDDAKADDAKADDAKADDAKADDAKADDAKADDAKADDAKADDAKAD